MEGAVAACKGQGLEQILPGVEDRVCGDRCKVVEESSASCELFPRRAPEVVGDVANSVKGEGQKVQGHQYGGEMLVAVTEIMFDVIALGFQDVEGLVFDFPAGTAAGGQSGDVAGADLKIGDEAVAVGHFIVGVEDLDLEPVDLQGILAIAQRNIVDPAVSVCALSLAMPDGLFACRKFDACSGNVFPDQGMRGWLADEDEMPVDRGDRFAQGLTGEQVVTEINRIEPCVLLTVGRQPSLGRCVLAVLLFGAILRGNEFRFERDHLVMSGSDQGRSQHGVEILGPALAALACRAVRAMDFLGTVIFGSVQGDQYMIAQSAEGVQAIRYALQCCDHFSEDRIEQFRLRRIQHGSNLIVGGNLGDVEQGLAIRARMVILELLLMVEEGWALHEECRERGHPEVDHSIGRIRAATLVGEPFQASSQRVQEGRENVHPLLESDSLPVANPLYADRVKKSHFGPVQAGQPRSGYPRTAPRINIDSY